MRTLPTVTSGEWRRPHLIHYPLKGPNPNQTPGDLGRSGGEALATNRLVAPPLGPGTLRGVQEVLQVAGGLRGRNCEDEAPQLAAEGRRRGGEVWRGFLLRLAEAHFHRTDLPAGGQRRDDPRGDHGRGAVDGSGGKC